MITQYTSNYSSISSDIQNLIANKVGIADEYILMQTGQNEFTALIKSPLGKVREIIISRSSNNTQYTVNEKSNIEFSYKVSNEYYTFSNVGLGKSLDLPVYDGITAYSLCGICCVLFLGIMFKGVLFKCLKRKR